MTRPAILPAGLARVSDHPTGHDGGWHSDNPDAIEVQAGQGQQGRVGLRKLRPIRKGEVIESCPVLVLPAEAVGNDEYKTGLHDYCFAWGRGTVALVLGYGSLYNHSYKPNARYDDIVPLTKEFTRPSADIGRRGGDHRQLQRQPHEQGQGLVRPGEGRGPAPGRQEGGGGLRAACD